MKTVRFFAINWKLTLGRLCQQRWLLAGLALLCFLLPFGAGRAAEVLLSRGVDFHGVTLAITAPEGDGVPQKLEQLMGDMEDIAQYCKIVSMDEGAALAALERGEITAVAAWSDYAAGYLAVQQAVRAVREQSQELEPLSFSIVRGEDIYAPENQKLLFPVTS